MNSYQQLWWEQARSDHELFSLVRRKGVAPCHALHYLQMTTEKIAKAYFWRSGSPPPRSHAGFAQFLRILCQIRRSRQQFIAHLFSFKRFQDFQNWVRKVLPIAYELEQLSPDLANDGPNPEYPWPHAGPTAAPVNHQFAIWLSLTSGLGRDLMRVIRIAVERFGDYADL